MSEKRAVAVFDFAGPDEGDLPFSKGDYIMVTDDSDTEGWWEGRDDSGRTGVFPYNYVQLQPKAPQRPISLRVKSRSGQEAREIDIVGESVSSLRVTGVDDSGPSVLYSIQAVTTAGPKSAKKSYADFQSLSQEMRKLFPQVAKRFYLPPSDLEDYGKDPLEQYLHNLIGVPGLGLLLMTWLVPSGSSAGGAGGESKAAATGNRASLRVGAAAHDTSDTGSFSLSSLSAFDDLMNDGYTIETRQDGDGSSKAAEGQRVTIHVEGMVWDGAQTLVTKFASTRTSNTTFSFNVGTGAVVAGLDTAVRRLSLGERAMITVSPRLAYDSKGVPHRDIPPGATIVYDVELLSIGDGAATPDDSILPPPVAVSARRISLTFRPGRTGRVKIAAEAAKKPPPPPAPSSIPGTIAEADEEEEDWSEDEDAKPAARPPPPPAAVSTRAPPPPRSPLPVSPIAASTRRSPAARPRPPVPGSPSRSPSTTNRPPVPAAARSGSTTNRPPVPAAARSGSTTNRPPVPAAARSSSTTNRPPVPAAARSGSTTNRPPVPAAARRTSVRPPVPAAARRTSVRPPVPTIAAAGSNRSVLGKAAPPPPPAAGRSGSAATRVPPAPPVAIPSRSASAASASAPAAAAGAATAAAGAAAAAQPGRFSMAELLGMKESGAFPGDVDKKSLEMYLSDDEFATVFNMSREQFTASPRWKQTNKKKAVKLF